MNTRTKIALDKALGLFVAYPLNLLVRLVGKIMRFDHSLQKDMKRIVVCKFKGMGSIVQATPLLQALRARYPHAELIFVSSIENKAILERIDLLNEIILIDDRGFGKLIRDTGRLIGKLIRKRADLYIDLEIYSHFSSIVTTLSLAHDRFGYFLRSNTYRMGMYTHMMYFNTKAPIAEAYMQFARLLRYEEETPSLFPLPFKEQTSVGLNNYWVINPNASDLRYERRWPATKFVELLHELLDRFPEKTFVLIGSNNERSYVNSITKEFQHAERVVDMSGKTNIEGLLSLLKHAELVITNDTGPMHLSAALQTSVLALFGPCSPQQYGLGPHVRAIYKNLYCSPCVHEFIVPPCKGDNQCMKQISVKEVLNALNDYPNVKHHQTIGYKTHDGKALGTVIR